MITSPYVRAAQTAEIFAETLGFSLGGKYRLAKRLKPAANPTEILKEIAQLKAKEIACFGHAPHLKLADGAFGGSARQLMSS